MNIVIDNLNKKSLVLWAMAFIGIVIFMVIFINTWVDYNENLEYKKEIEEKGFDIKNIDKYIQSQNYEQLKLKKLQKRFKLSFSQSDFIQRIIDIAKQSRISANNLALIKHAPKRSRIKKEFDELKFDLRVSTYFSRLGAFLSRLERKTSGNTKFEYIVRINRINIAVKKRSGALISALLNITVYRKAGYNG